jgi:hypothetical protein
LLKRGDGGARAADIAVWRRKELSMTSRIFVRSVLGAILFAAASVAAQAQELNGSDCQGDMAKLQKTRETQIESINKLTKGGKSKLDPIAACPKLKSLAATETRILEYMTKNQKWCDIPDDVLENVKGGRDKTASFAGQACKIAAMARKAQQGGMAGGAPPPPRLPTGPL